MSGSPSSPQGSDSCRRDTIWDTSTGRLVASPDSVNSSRCCTQHQQVSDEGHTVEGKVCYETGISFGRWGGGQI